MSYLLVFNGDKLAHIAPLRAAWVVLFVSAVPLVAQRSTFLACEQLSVSEVCEALKRRTLNNGTLSRKLPVRDDTPRCLGNERHADAILVKYKQINLMMELLLLVCLLCDDVCCLSFV